MFGCILKYYMLIVQTFILIHQDQIRYEIEEPTEEILNYFYMNPDDGAIILRRAPDARSPSRFTVSKRKHIFEIHLQTLNNLTLCSYCNNII